MIEVSHVCVEGALSDVSLRVEPGEIVGLIGANGSGKTTLARVACAAQRPQAGSVAVDGIPVADDASAGRVRRLVGYVGQNPADQVISTVVYDELAFGLRNIGCTEEEIPVRVAGALDAVGLVGFEERAVTALSGGELQRVVCAAVLAMQPQYVVLDEVTAQLDASLRSTMRAIVRAMAARGCGVLLVTHDPLEALLCDQLLVLDVGRVVWSGTPRTLLMDECARWDRTLPPSAYIDVVRAALDLGFDACEGFEPEMLGAWLRAAVQGGVLTACECERLGVLASAGLERRERDSDGVLQQGNGVCLERVSVAYEGIEAVHEASFEAPAGAVTLLAGPSGAGKTTLACVAAGLIEPAEGTVEVTGAPPRPGEVALAFQNPEEQLFLETVERELAFAPENRGCAPEEVARRVHEAAGQLDIEGLLASDPFCLSGGQARRVALASILTLGPRAVVLDEPTAGLDAAARAALQELVERLAARGLPVLVVSHDLEEWLVRADRVVLVRAGSVVWQGTPTALAERQDLFAAAGLSAPPSWRVWAELRGLQDKSGAAPSVGNAGAQVTAGEGACGEHGSAASRRRVPRHRAPLAIIDARVKIVLLLAATAAVFASGAPWALAVWMVASFAALAASGIGLRALGRTLRPVLVLFAVIVCVNLVSCDGSADIALAGPVGLSTAGALRAGSAIARIVMLVCLALAVAESTTPTKLADACTRLVRPLARVGVPVDDVGLVLSMALRFIPSVTEEAGRIRQAQRARGVDFSEGSAIVRVRAWATVLTPLVVGLFRRADRVAASMDARCYGIEGRSTIPPAPLAARDCAVLCLGLIAMVALVAASHLL